MTRSVSTTKSSLKRSCGREGERQSMAINEILLEAKLWKGGREAINGHPINGDQWQSNALDGDHLKRVQCELERLVKRSSEAIRGN